ncbi:hypothetical protein FPV67DRAFT_1664334 [Lyophyllum atratum]|nr:hypothetical protein FPV67DRAFT_1664334 [Lyophyllum atratum]
MEVTDEDAPFFFPLGASVELGLPKGLDVVHEEVEEEGSTSEVDEDEDDEDMFGQAGGIQIIFTPPEADEGESFDSQRSPSPSPAKPSIPTNDLFDEDHDEDSIPFNFGRPLAYESMEEATEKTVFSAPPASKPFNFGRPLVSEPATEVKDVVIAAAGMITPPSSHPRHTEHRAPSPSSIPRSTTFKPSFSFTDMTTSTPPRSAATRVVSASNYSSNAFVTPPNKRGGAMPSFIPQPISSPSPLRSTTTTAKPKAASPSATFIPQAQRKPLMLANNNAKSQNVPSGAPHGSTFAPQISTMLNAVMNARSVRRSSDLHAAPAPSAHSEMKSVDLSDHFNIPTNISGSATTPTQAYPYPVQDRNLPSSQYSRSDAPASSYSCVESALKSDGVVARREPALRTAPLKRGFVSKEKQLEKLRSRLEREGAMKMRTSVSVLCNNCDDGEVSL